MILVVRVFLIALLLVGSTESARCQALCARLSDSQATARARSAETTAPEHAGCHGGGVASTEPESPPDSSSDSCQDGCCTVLARATAAPIFTPGPTLAGTAMLASLDFDEVRIRPERLCHARPAARLKTPFQFRNPPLLI